MAPATWGALIPELTIRGHEVLALVRQQSAARLPPNCRAVVGDPLKRETFQSAILAGATFIQLIGVPHPSPAKAQQFREIDLVSVRESVAAAAAANASHFVYLSVAQPAPMMKDYIAVRAEGEAMIRAAGLRATILRPWYVLGPGHRWPYALIPFYWICERLPQRVMVRDGLDLLRCDKWSLRWLMRWRAHRRAACVLWKFLRFGGPVKRYAPGASATLFRQDATLGSAPVLMCNARVPWTSVREKVAVPLSIFPYHSNGGTSVSFSTTRRASSMPPSWVATYGVVPRPAGRTRLLEC